MQWLSNDFMRQGKCHTPSTSNGFGAGLGPGVKPSRIPLQRQAKVMSAAEPCCRWTREVPHGELFLSGPHPYREGSG